MIRSSADILRILGGDSVVRMLASVQIVDTKPPLTGEDGTFIYIDRFPSEQEFEATWRIWVRDYADAPIEVLIDRLKTLLPNLRGKETAMGWDLSTTDFKSESTQTKPSGAPAVAPQADLSALEARFEALAEDIQDQMLLVNSGRAGKDGQDGRDGVDGRDGKDLITTDAELFDLQDVDQSVLPMQKGQVLTWDGDKWTNLYVPQVTTSSGGGGTTSGGTTGVSSTIAWTYHPHDHTEDPNSGHFHTNTADGDLVTTFHVSNETSRGNDVEVLLRDLLQQGYDRIYVALADDLSQAHLYAVSGYLETSLGFEITVSHIETAGTEPDFQNAKGYEFLFTKSATASSGGIPEAPQDGNYYVRQNGSWVNLRSALSALGINTDTIVDGGNFTSGSTSAADNTTPDGGNFTSGSTSATNSDTYDGGTITGTNISGEVIDGGYWS